ncbi:MAG: rod shape-determining protein RodA [Peptococcaceae bacterium]|nr:rod shape-determining protein RodA [Peptococcaceae bacterium]
MKNKSVLKNIDYVLVGCVTLILVAGFMALRSATVNASDFYGMNFVARQMAWSLIGYAAFFLILLFDYSKLAKYHVWLYVLNLGQLAAVLVFGKSVSGAQAWIPIGSYQFQPAELAKILMILGLAQFLVPRIGKLNKYTQMLPAFIYVGIPLGLILLQPDLGTGLVFVAILFGMLLVAGASPVKLLLLIVGGVGAVVFAIYAHYKWGLPIPLKDYQLMRLVVFVNPNIDPRGHGWNVIQAQITVGSGGLFGKGWGMGFQTANEFLPTQWTDFIFCVLAEEFGFIGCAVLLILFLVLIFRGIQIAQGAKDPYGALVAAGILSMYVFHVLQNVGMAVGIMPITGIPLPFVSYGGSSLLANMAALGIIMSIHIYKDTNMFNRPL